MNIFKYNLKAIIAFVILTLSATPSYAYLDPASATIILQVLIGAVAGGIVYLKLYWGKFRKFFNRFSKKSDGDKPSSENDEAIAGEENE